MLTSAANDNKNGWRAMCVGLIINSQRGIDSSNIDDDSDRRTNSWQSLFAVLSMPFVRAFPSGWHIQVIRRRAAPFDNSFVWIWNSFGVRGCKRAAKWNSENAKINFVHSVRPQQSNARWLCVVWVCAVKAISGTRPYLLNSFTVFFLFGAGPLDRARCTCRPRRAPIKRQVTPPQSKLATWIRTQC